MAKKPNYASLYTLRSDGRYVASYTDDTGRHYVYDRDPERLWHRLNDPKEPEPLTFGRIAEAWHDEHWEKIRPGTQACYAAPYQRALDLFEDTPAAEILPSDIKAHLERLKRQGYGAKSIKTQKTVYRLIFRAAIADEETGKIIRIDPTEAVSLPSGIKRPEKRTAPEDTVIKKIRAEADTAYWGLFCLLLISTGLRRGEALALQWGDVDLKAKTISVSKTVVYRSTVSVGDTKTENGVRTVPILPDLLPRLKAARPKKAAPDDYIFAGTDPKKPMAESIYRRHWMHYCKDMGFVSDTPEIRKSKQGKTYTVHHYKTTLTPHVLRHGYATMLYDAGVDPYAAQKLLGHADIQTTLAIYTHLKQEREASSLKALEKYVTRALSE